MTDVSDRQRAIIGKASAFALWRDPGSEAPVLFASARPPTPGPVFDAGGAETAPSFVMAPFSAEDGNNAWHIAADVIDTPSGLSVRDGAEALLHGTPGPFHAPSSGGARPLPVPRADYEARVARILAEIREGRAEKVVTSRAAPVAMGRQDLIARFEALAEAYPPAFVALVSSAVTGTWLIATPETLLDADADTLRTMALAGTQWPADLTDLSAVTWPDKLVAEQAIVAREIRGAFEALGIPALSETPARTVRAANLCHLRSDFSAPLPEPATLGALLRRLHPTSAVCGMPRDVAREIIRREEGDTRGFYTGFLGYRGHAGATRLFVNLRSARIVGETAFLHVGGGIVADSVPAIEWEETEEKTRTIRRVL
jgi:isochorismate synthase